MSRERSDEGTAHGGSGEVTGQEPFQRAFEGELVGRQAPYRARSKLSSAQRTELRQKLADAGEVTPELVRALALEYGVSTSTVKNLKP